MPDDDKELSGDGSCRTEDEATDRTYQTAAITERPDGAEVGNGGQIYAERYFWVTDQATGKSYVMIEIAQEGSNQKYYTFHGSYGIPPEGATLKVKSSCDVAGEWLDYKDLGTAERGTCDLKSSVVDEDDGKGVFEEPAVLTVADLPNGRLLDSMFRGTAHNKFPFRVGLVCQM